MHYLLFHPDLEDALRKNRPQAGEADGTVCPTADGKRLTSVAQAVSPAIRDIAAFVDEMIRLFPPAFAAKRFTLCPVEIAGVNIPAEAHLLLVLFAAHRDPARYRQPDETILHRAGPPHLSFSDGPHSWLVRRLGQLERETVLRVLLAEFPPLRPMCQAGEIRFAAPPEFYVPAALPVRFDA
jgi:cytochrome P450